MSTDSQVTVVTSSSPSFQDVLESLADYKASLALWRYCPPVILVLGTLGNLMILWVLGISSGASSSSMSVYFRALAVSDLILLYIDLLRNWIKYMFHLNIPDRHSLACRIHLFLVYGTCMTSAWFLVMMTTQRALSVVWPHKMRQVGNRKTASMAVAITVAVCCLLNAHNLYGYELRYYPDYGQYYCDYVNPDYENFVRGSWPWIDMCMSSLFPFCFLLTSNTLLMWKVTSSIRDVRKLTHEGRKSQEVVSQRQKQSTSLNVTLIFVSAMFVLLTLPIAVFLALDLYYSNADLDGGDAEHTSAASLGWAVTSLLWYSNSAVNFYLYCLTGSRFRAQVWQSLCCVMSTHRTNAKSVEQVQRHTNLHETTEAPSHM